MSIHLKSTLKIDSRFKTFFFSIMDVGNYCFLVRFRTYNVMKVSAIALLKQLLLTAQSLKTFFFFDWKISVL